MVDVKKEKREAEVVILNNVTKDDFIKATFMLVNDDKFGELMNANPIFLLLFPLITAELWKTLVELKDKKEGEK